MRIFLYHKGCLSVNASFQSMTDDGSVGSPQADDG